MVYCFVFIESVNAEPWHFIFPLLKFTFISLILLFFYKLFVKPRLFKNNINRSDWKHAKAENAGDVKIELFRDKTLNPSLVNLIVRNNGNNEVDLEAPVLVFKRWFRERRFRIVSVDFSDIYPMLINGGKVSVVRIDLRQFYGFAPELIKAGRLGAEMKEVDGRTYSSGTIRLKWW
jgi:hypothetical protein